MLGAAKEEIRNMGYLQGFDDCDRASEVVRELRAARAKFPRPFNSAHEGFAVLQEEVDELWEVVRAKGRTKERMREEAVQIAAMALRFIEDVCDKP